MSACLLTVLWVLQAGQLNAQNAGSPCHAVRWSEGGHWTGMGNNGCGVDDAPNAPQPQGIVRCANAADTESGIDWNTTYVPAEFTIVPSMCIDPSPDTLINVDPPFSGQKIAWFNFDVRPYAGLYDFQTIATGNYELNWALYADTLSQICGVNMDGLSGNCAGALALLACGTDFNGWAPQPFVTPIFDQPTNLYLVVWRRGATNSSNDVFDFTFKARYGCGDFCFTELNGPDTVTCNPNGSYTVRQNINATSTTITVTAPGNTGIVYSHTPFTFTTASAEPATNTGWVEVTFPASVANYSITFTPSTEANSDFCDILVVTGTAPECCIPPPCPTLTGPTTVCPGSTTQFCVPTGLGGYSWSVSGNGTIVGPTNTECVSVTAGSTCNSSFTLTLVVGAPGCTSSCNYMITVDDDIVPTITCPANLTIEGCNTGAIPAPHPAYSTTPVITTYSVFQGAGGSAMDNCAIATGSVVYQDASSGTCPTVVTRTWTVFDECLNSATCTQTFTIDDTTPPMVTCPANLTIEGCNTGAIPAPHPAYSTTPVITTYSVFQGAGGSAMDNCAIATGSVVYQDASSGTCPTIVTRTWTVFDECLNSATCTQTFTIDDTTPPTIACPADVTIACTSNTDPVFTGGSATASDVCDGSLSTFKLDVIVAGSCAQSYTINRTWAAQDGCGNQNTCLQVITVTNTPPAITCPVDVTIQCNASTMPANTGTATATDNCGGTTMITHTNGPITPGNCPDAYSFVRTWTATDNCGSTATCTQTITVVDTQAPMITCPANVTIACTADTSPTSQGSAMATDNCDTAPTVTHSDVTVAGSCPQNYTINRTWSATDNCSNTATCLQVITVANTPPTITCPVDVTIQCDVSTLPANTGTATASDNCGGTTTITFSNGTIVPGACPQAYSFVRTWTATDNCGATATCTQTITVVDTQAPMITCPPNVTVACTADTSPTSQGSATATDNCDTTPTIGHTDNIIPGNCPQSYTIQRTWTATDDCMNGTNCVQTIVVTNTPPTITCPVDVTIQCDVSTLPANTGTALASDNCGGTTTITFSNGPIVPGACPQAYSFVRTFTAMDNCGSTATCTQTITVVDTQAPMITCPPNVTVACTANTSPTPMGTGAATSTDNCDTTPTVTSNDNIIPGNCPQSYTIQRTWTATDDCMNSTSCMQTIVVTNTPPTITCPVDVTIQCDVSTLPANTGTATASDNCGGTTTVDFTNGTIVPGACPQAYSFVRTWTATDNCGSTATCTQTITVVDTQAPMIACPANVTVSCTSNVPPVNTGSVGATDNCGGTVTVTHVSDVTSDSTCVNRKTITRTYRATDACGNSATCAQTIRVQDDMAPMIACPANITVSCTSNVPPVNTGSVGATDNCGGTVTVTHVSDVTSDSTCVNRKTITRTYRATDSCGNSATCSHTIRVQDDMAPMIACPANVTVSCTSNVPPVNTGSVGATDNCGGTVTVTHVSDVTSDSTCVNRKTITRTYRATDSCGNSMTCSHTITVFDGTPPVFTFCPPGSNLGCNPTGVPAPGAAEATDNCGGTPTITSALGPITEDGCLRTQTRTYTATDACGNTATCTQVFTWTVDVTPPVFTFCPPGSDLGCNPTGIPGPGAATATDACSPPTITTSLGPITEDGCLRSQTRTYLATDACGNTATCTQVFTWTLDQTPPVFTFCPPGSDLGCNPTGIPAPGAATATDACGPPVITTALSPITENGCLRTQIRTYTATDVCGNTATCTQVFTWTVDTAPPAITCPPMLTIQCDVTANLSVPANMTIATWLGSATATDACGTPVITNNYSPTAFSNGCGATGTQTVTFTATDACLNTATCTAIIQIVDTTPPVITCPPTLTIQCDDTLDLTIPGNMVIQNWLNSATATDACGTPMITNTYSPTGFSDGCGATGTQTVFFTATDECGNTSGCSALIQIVDTAPPVCMAEDFMLDTVIDPLTGVIALNPTWFDGGSYDDCGSVTTAVFPTSVSCANEGLTVVTLTVTDECGNSSTCTANFTLNCVDPCLEIVTHVYLEGSATDPNGEAAWAVPMRTTLNDLRILPGQTYNDPFFGNFYSPPGQPYDVAPWNYMGIEGDGYDSNGDPMMGDANYPPTVVDWVLVSLRDTVNGPPLCMAAALLHEDGLVEFIEGFECCNLDLFAPYYVVIEHRNHLIVMSDEPTAVNLMNSTITYDFRNQNSYVDDPFMFGFVKGQKEILPGTWAMFAGNGEQSVSGAADIDLNQDDRAAWQIENGDFGYYRIGDYNMNGDVNFNDRVTWERNNGNSSSVPRD